MNKSRSIFIKKTKEWTEQEVSFVSEVLEHTFENMLNGNELNHEVSVLLTNDEEIRELNKKYRKIDKSTNVLSFSITSDTIVNELRMIGDIVISKEKIDPYLRPLYDALNDLMPKKILENNIESGIIEIAPLAFMRGRTLENAFIILDEAQNTTNMQMKMFVTRLGRNSKMVILGDVTQIDLPTGSSSGLNQILKLLPKEEGIEIINFQSKDIVRHRLVDKIVKAYSKIKKEK